MSSTQSSSQCVQCERIVVVLISIRIGPKEGAGRFCTCGAKIAGEKEGEVHGVFFIRDNAFWTLVLSLIFSEFLTSAVPKIVSYFFGKNQ